MIEIEFSENAKRELLKAPQAVILSMKGLVIRISERWFNGLPGRNKASHEVDTDNYNWKTLVNYAIKHKLWHYHIGLPKFNVEDRKSGDYVSDWMFHYQLLEENAHIRIVSIDTHPFQMPAEDKF